MNSHFDVMSNSRKDPATKPCEHCGVMMIQSRWKNGALDGAFKNRRFCTRYCYRIHDDCGTSVGTVRAHHFTKKELLEQAICRTYSDSDETIYMRRLEHPDGTPDDEAWDRLMESACKREGIQGVRKKRLRTRRQDMKTFFESTQQKPHRCR
jgi:hypothetical protein